MKKERIVIVASGPSLQSLDPCVFNNINSHIIAVNGASEWLPNFNSFFTLDLSPQNIKRMKVNRRFVDYYAAIDRRKRSLIPPNVNTLERISQEPKDTIPRGTPLYWFRRWGCIKGLSENPKQIHSGNSAFGALGLAYHWKPKKILILGVDGNHQPRMNGEGPPKFNLSHLPLLFKYAVPQLERAGIEVVNGSRYSSVDCFKRTTPEEGIEWINSF